MDKKRFIKTVGCAAAFSAIVVSVCGCSIIKMAYRNMSAAEGAVSGVEERSGEYVAYGGGGETGWESGAAEYAGDLTLGTAALESTAMYRGRPSEDKEFKQYEKYGATYSQINGAYWFFDKPIAVFYDPGNHTMTSGDYMEFGAYVLVTRDALGNIQEVAEVTRDEMEQALAKNGTMVLGKNESLKQLAEEMGFRYYTEDVSVKDMTVKELNRLTNDLYAKYRHQNAAIRCNDYVMYLYKDAMLRLSSFCGSDNNQYGVKLSADYNIADEIDLHKLDTVEIDRLLLDLLSNRQFDDPGAVEAAAKKAVAEHYGISEKNLVAVSSLI